jgi:hypothetical protein
MKDIFFIILGSYFSYSIQKAIISISAMLQEILIRSQTKKFKRL